MGKFTPQTGRKIALASRTTYLSGRVPAEYSDEFYTPAWVVKPLGPFDLDPCAGPVSSFAARNYRGKNGLGIRWSGRVWLNPPYSDVDAWIAKFIFHANGTALFNARCETNWFQMLAGDADALLFLKGRVSFHRDTGRAGRPPVGSVLIAYGADNATALRESGLAGLLVIPQKRSIDARPVGHAVKR